MLQAQVQKTASHAKG